MSEVLLLGDKPFMCLEIFVNVFVGGVCDDLQLVDPRILPVGLQYVLWNTKS